MSAAKLRERVAALPSPAATLGLAGHGVDDKRARAVLRRIAATGLLIRTSPTRAICNAT
ncbi:hypothetical protein [Streptomyces sp. NPDC018352]|uniref:hypothetical protein n=1 Tax=Streptomyces sp. NPDC018352 TaxID=3157194 RepID=UPI0033E457CC